MGMGGKDKDINTVGSLDLDETSRAPWSSMVLLEGCVGRLPWGAQAKPQAHSTMASNEQRSRIDSPSSSSQKAGSNHTSPQSDAHEAAESSESSPLNRFFERARTIVSTENLMNACSYSESLMPWNTRADVNTEEQATLGISPMMAPRENTSETLPNESQNKHHRQRKCDNIRKDYYSEEIEVLPNHQIEIRAISNHQDRYLSTSSIPFGTLEVFDPIELERSISELTMRSSFAHETSSQRTLLPNNRRMAYYAVGAHTNQQGGRGGNRRCYFTGKLVLGDAPFYAGCVQQGMRTLIVFCLPSALGLPKTGDNNKHNMANTSSGQGLLASIIGGPNRDGAKIAPQKIPLHEHIQETNRVNMTRRQMAGASVASNSYMSKSRLSSMDDFSMSIEGDLDPNWKLDCDYLLSILPDASKETLRQMNKLYPELFETLPTQIQDPSVWKLFSMFCFFSGLPIASGDLYYKVRDDVAEEVYGEGIILSHDVMEAVNGASTDLVTLPNQHTFRYLKTHYSQQCAKLDESVFQRSCWRRVAPEV